MKRFTMIVKAGLPALAIAAAGSALAQSVASASVSSLGYQLIDLDLNDGVTPWITFDDQWIVDSSTFVFADAGGVSQPAMQAFGHTLGTIAVGNADGLAFAMAGPREGLSVAQAFANSASSWVSTRQGYLLSPNTAVTFFAYGHAATTGTNDVFAGSTLYAVSNESIYSTGQLSAFAGQTQEGWLLASAGSFGANAAQGWVGMNMYANATAPTLAAPVPEPAAPAMLLGGLGLLAVLGRRRAR